MGDQANRRKNQIDRIGRWPSDLAAFVAFELDAVIEVAGLDAVAPTADRVIAVMNSYNGMTLAGSAVAPCQGQLPKAFYDRGVSFFQKSAARGSKEGFRPSNFDFRVAHGVRLFIRALITPWTASPLAWPFTDNTIGQPF